MTESVLIQHPPAVKVGGRRLSISTKHKPHSQADSASPNSTQEPNIEPEPEPDYPRPAPPGEDQVHQHRHDEDLPPKKERKHGAHDSERKMMEYAHWKAESTRPTRDVQAAPKAFGASGRIAQPAGKGLG